MEAGAVAAARRHRFGSSLPPRQPLESEPELLREEGPYRREAEPYGREAEPYWRGRGPNRKGRGIQDGRGKENRSEETRERMRQPQRESGRK